MSVKVLCVSVFTVMEPPCLLMMLMMSFHLLVFTTSQPSPDHQIIKEAFKFISDHSEQIEKAVDIALDLFDVSNPLVKTAIDVISLVLTGKKRDDKVLKTLIDEFKNLNFKLDQYQKELKWDIWAAGAYHKPEMKIKDCWTIFETLQRSLAELGEHDAKRQNLITDFKSFYVKCEPATRKLRDYMTAKGPTFISNLGLMLAEHLKCDQNAIKQYSVFILKLVFEGNLLNQVYYHLTETGSSAKLEEAVKIQYDVASAIFQMQKYCINQTTKYVREDVEVLIDKKKDRAKLAEDIRVFLEKKDNRYEWMVVAFKAKNSDHSFIKIWNKHTLTLPFTEVTKDDVRVGVARQLKGQHTKADKIIAAIKKCFKKLPLCYEVEKELSKCQEKVDNVQVTQTYTAVHVYHGGAHESLTEVKSDISSHNDNVNPDTISLYENVDSGVSTSHESDSKANIYIGQCIMLKLLIKKPFQGNFQVLLKSDEAIANENDPCSKYCGTKQQGQCVTDGSPSIAMCECNYPYYGNDCGKKINDNKSSSKTGKK